MKTQRLFDLSSSAALALAVVGASLTFVNCGANTRSQVSNDQTPAAASELSTELTERDCPKTITMTLSVNEVKPLRSLANNTEYQDAIEAFKVLALVPDSLVLNLNRTKVTKERCSYLDKGTGMEASAFIKKTVEEQFVDDLPRFSVVTRMTVKITESEGKNEFLSFFSIGTTESGETVVDNENDNVKQVLTPVGDKLRAIGSINYSFDFAKVD